MDVERATMARVGWRLVPFLVLCYLASYLDRVNVGFAALTMNKALGIDATQFAIGAGIFFLSYFLLEVPSNLALDRFGARKWIARIMITWGVISGLMAFIPAIARLTGLSPITTFYGIRVLLGAAEAGFFPGIIFYLTLWFPSVYRARIIGLFMAAIPLSSVIGSPVSGLLLGLDTAGGFAGWQWLFVIEALPAVVLGIATFFFLTDRPADATWLAPEQRQWLTARLAEERAQRERAQTFGIGEALGNTRVLLLAFVYFGVVAANYGFTFFLPQIVHDFGIGDAATGFVTAIPYVVGAAGMVWWGRHSDRARERREHVGLAALLAALGLAAGALVPGAVGKMIAFCFASFGIFAALPVFWTLPTTFLSGAAAAGGIAIINSLGNLSGFVGPYLMGSIRDRTGSFTAGLLAIAGLAALAMLVALSLTHESSLEDPVEGA